VAGDRLGGLSTPGSTGLVGGLRARLSASIDARAGRLSEPWRSAYRHSQVTALNLHFLHELTERLGRLGVEGDIVECGVYRGGSASVLGWSMMQLRDGSPRRLWLFDSFAGFPKASDRDGAFSHSLEGRYVGSEELTRQLLARAGVPPERYRIVAGRFEDTFANVQTPPVALLHVDCDFYEPVKLTLEKFFEHMTPGGFVVLNDYGIYKGAHEATDEFLEARGLELEPVAIDPTASFFQKPGAGCSGLPVAGCYPGWPGAVA
jgi:O-methyltransferase